MAFNPPPIKDGWANDIKLGPKTSWSMWFMNMWSLLNSTTTTATTASTTATTALTTATTALTSSIGYGQTWQTFTSAQRVIGTVYTNTTSKPIMVIAQTSGVAVVVVVGGVTIIPGGAVSSPCSFIVPPSTTYAVTAGTFTSWAELR